MIKTLLELRADPNRLVPEIGYPLTLAVCSGNAEIVGLLLNAGANVDVRTTDGSYGSALIAAIDHANREIIEMLLKAGADVNLQVTYGRYCSPLVAAAQFKATDILEDLMKAGADINMKTMFGNHATHGSYGSALIAAVLCGSNSLVQILLEAGADATMQVMHGEFCSALTAAIGRGDEDALKLLLEAGADPLLSNNVVVGVSEIQSTIVCDWELPHVFSRGTEELNIYNAPTMTKKQDGVLLCTCAEYLGASYGVLGNKVLEMVVQALKDPDGLYVIKLRATHHQLEISFKDSVEDLSNAVIWLCLTFRDPPSDGPQVSSGTFDGKWFKLNEWKSLSDLATLDTTCWSGLFESAVITVEPEIEPNSEWGLVLSFRNMIQLAAVEYPVFVSSGVVLMGYSTALIPMARKDRQTIEWHLEVATHDSQLKTSELKAIKSSWMQTQNVDELQSVKNLLGWCPNADIRLGTIHATADIRRSDASTKHTSWSLTGANLQIVAQSAGPAQIGGQLGFSFSRTLHTVRFTPSKNYLKCLRNSISEQMVIYDTTQQRAWLIPLVCVLHQMLLSYSEVHGIASGVPQAVPGGSNNAGLSSFDALKDNASFVLENSGGEELTVRELIMKFSVNLSQTSIRKPNGRKVYGYEFWDIIEDSTRSELKQKQLDRPGLTWAPLLGEVNCLFCSDFGDAIVGDRAVGVDSPCNRVPPGRDLLAAPTYSINTLLQRHGVNLWAAIGTSGPKTSGNGQCWMVAGTHFQQCSHQVGGHSCWESPTFLQDIRHMDIVAETLTVKLDSFPNGAVVFGCCEEKALSFSFSASQGKSSISAGRRRS
ncbi:hypothetical protein BJX65DRAFT_296117 [Aspergillus insuetus]